MHRTYLEFKNDFFMPKEVTHGFNADLKFINNYPDASVFASFDSRSQVTVSYIYHLKIRLPYKEKLRVFYNYVGT